MPRPSRSSAFVMSLLGTAFVTTACSGGGGGSTPPSNPPPIVVSESFPQGNAIAQGGGTAWDIVSVKKTIYGQFFGANGNAYDTLRVDVTFAQDISNALPAPGQMLTSGSQLGVSVGIDSDGNHATGNYSGCPNSIGTPFEYISDTGASVGRLSDGNYGISGSNGLIYSGTSNPENEAQTTVSGHVFSQIIFLATVGAASGSSNPKVTINVSVVNGNNTGNPTDCEPMGGSEI